MATHDYVIANGTGAAVRSDLNNALAAIVSNNSGSSEPGTTYAYQWWADTNANVLKIRNSSNDAWITLRELDGTMLIEDGSASTPGLAFADDVNTGIFSPAADQIGFATGGAERLEIGSSEVVFNDPSNDVDFRVESNGQTHMLFVDAGNDRVGIGTSSPVTDLELSRTGNNADGLTLTCSDHTNSARLFFESTSTNGAPTLFGEDGNLRFNIGGTPGSSSGTEHVRLDTSGRLLVGTSSAQGTHLLQIEGQSNSNADGGSVALRRGEAASAMSADDFVGSIEFMDNAGANFARIIGRTDAATGGVNGNPGRLEFYTENVGSDSGPAERLRIDSSGHIKHTGLRDGAGENKLANYTVPSHNTSEEDVLIFSVANESSSNEITFGGGPSAYNAATAIIFRTASAVDTTVGSEAMRVDSSSRLQIGTTAGTGNLNVAGTGDAALDLIADSDNNGSNQWPIINFRRNSATGTPAARIYHQESSGALIADNGGTEFFRNTSSAHSVFSAEDYVIYSLSENGSSSSIALFTGRHSATIGNNSSGTEAIRIFTSGTVSNATGAYNTLSDERLKENIVDATSQWDDIKNLRIRKFNYAENTGHPTHTQIGLVAQEAEQICPGLVQENENEEDAACLDKDGNQLNSTKSVLQSVLYMKAVKALQEAMDRIETLEAKVAALEAG